MSLGSGYLGITSLSGLAHWVGNLEDTSPMPVLFLGHGSPMNAIEDNPFSRSWKQLGKDLPKPKAILCISAHWETQGTKVTAMERPRTIHDFGGFPKALFDVQYPAPGAPTLANTIREQTKSAVVNLDASWGLDHGCWSVVRPMFPKADIPVLQLSLNRNFTPAQHFALATELSFLRKKGILIVGSGNIVHHLGKLDWSNPQSAYDWAITANEGIKKRVLDRDISSLQKGQALGKEYQLAIPTPEHYLPLLYTMGSASPKEKISIFNDNILMGSIAMTSFRIG